MRTIDTVVREWNESVMPTFERFIAAVDDTQSPVPEEFFEVGFSYSGCPLLGFLDPKALYCALEEYGGLSAAQKHRVEGVFFAYLEKWGLVLRKLAIRYGIHEKTVAMENRLRTYVSGIRKSAVCRQDVLGGTTFEAYSALQNAFREIGAAVHEAEVCGGGSAAAEGSALRAVQSAPRREYERYCMTSQALAELFGVDRKTITRWKSERSDWADMFRAMSQSAEGMRRLVPEYQRYKRENRIMGLRGRTGYDDAVNYDRRRIDR